MRIWSAWLQGRKNAPRHVQQIFDLWERLNPDCNVKILEQEDVDAILSRLKVNTINMTPQVKTNMARLHLISTLGGVWVDATLLPTMPLMSWLTPQLRSNGFFAFRSTGEPELILQNWFLYSEKDNYFVENWLSSYCDYFKVQRFSAMSKRVILSRYAFDFIRYHRSKNKDVMYFVNPSRGRSCRVYPYAVLNYNLSYLFDTDPSMKKYFDEVPRFYNARTGLIGHFANDKHTPKDVFLEVALDLLACSPVHKLDARDQRYGELIELASERGLISSVVAP